MAEVSTSNPVCNPPAGYHSRSVKNVSSNRLPLPQSKLVVDSTKKPINFSHGANGSQHKAPEHKIKKLKRQDTPLMLKVPFRKGSSRFSPTVPAFTEELGEEEEEEEES